MGLKGLTNGLTKLLTRPVGGRLSMDDDTDRGPGSGRYRTRP